MKKLLILVLVLAFVSSANAALIGHWEFDGDGSDSSTNSNTALLGTGSGSTFTADANAGTFNAGGGYGGGYLHIDRTDFTNGEVARVDYDTSLDLGTGNVSWMGWFKTTNVSGHQTLMMTGPFWNGSNHPMIYFERINGGTISTGADDRAGTGVDFGGSATDDVWVHMATTRDSSGPNDIVSYYVNGVLENSAEASGSIDLTPFSGGADWHLTFGSGGWGRYSTMDIDDFRIYDDLKSAGDIQAIMPEPATIALLSLGGLALLRRRKR